MADKLLFTISYAARFLDLEVKKLKQILRISGLSSNFETNGHVGAETLRVLHNRLYLTK
ncbi:MAG: hypothetical protein ACYCW6_06480 [Candidatus Xenobia bacterium]